MPALFLNLTQLLADAVFCQAENSLNVREGRRRIVIVALQSVLEVLSIGGYLINHESGRLHYGATVLEFVGQFVSGFFQSAIETESLGFCQTAALALFDSANPGVGAIPLCW